MELRLRALVHNSFAESRACLFPAALALVLFSFPTQCFAWGAEGHRIVAAIAETTGAGAARQTLPAHANLTGATGFAYTSVRLTLELVLRGSAYQVTGTIDVNQLSPVEIQRRLSISGTLIPGVQGKLLVSGAAPGDQPQLIAILRPRSGATLIFDGNLWGIPSLGIANLQIGAS